MTREELAAAVYKVALLKGEFKLRSGQISNKYFDKYRFESQPELLRAIAKELKKILPTQTEILAGLELGGVPIATALSLETGIPCLFVRKKAKDYGTCQFAEGLDFKGKNLCIIEDVITTGGQVVLSTQDLRQAGAQVENVLCVIHRGKIPEPSLENINLNMKSLFHMEELLKFDNLK